MRRKGKRYVYIICSKNPKHKQRYVLRGLTMSPNCGMGQLELTRGIAQARMSASASGETTRIADVNETTENAGTAGTFCEL